MEDTDFRKLHFRPHPERALRETKEGKYWQRFKILATSQQVGAVSSIHFSPVRPFHYAITSSTRVIIMDAGTRDLRRQITRFKDRAYSGNFRGDGKLLVAGGEDGLLQVFETNSRTLLRQLAGHERPTHLARFALDRMHVLSGSDDATARWWDVTAGEQLLRFEGHTDYVRSGACHPTSANVLATGGYDHTCKLWDARSGKCTLTLDHGAPVEDMLFFPPGALLATAGGNTIAIWDLMAGGKLLTRLMSHQKTVTSLCWAPAAGPESEAGPRLLSGSLDGYVKVHNLDGFRTVHSLRHAAPVLSVGIASNAVQLAVGCADGSLVVRKREKAPAPEGETAPGEELYAPAKRPPRPLTAANYKYFLRGQTERASAEDYVVATQRGAQLQPYERLLRKFRYSEALDVALRTKQAAAVSAVLEDLAVRHGLENALSERDAEGLLPLLDHIHAHILDPRYQAHLTGLLNRILDIYAPALGISAPVDKRITQLKKLVSRELEDQESLVAVQGMLHMLVAATTAVDAPQEGEGIASTGENWEEVEEGASDPEEASEVRQRRGEGEHKWVRCRAMQVPVEGFEEEVGV